MSEIRHLINNQNEVWEYKDTLSTTILLEADPLNMYKGKFVEYMKAKAGALYNEYLNQGHVHAVAIELTNVRMKEIAENWKAAAKRVKS